MERHRIGIVIPALNEAGTIGSVVSLAAQYGIAIVIDDGSSDATAALSAAAGATVVRHEVNRGYDQALSSGFVRAAEMDCEYVVTLDGDGQHDPAILGRFIESLDRGADVALGLRDRRQRLAEHVFAWIAAAMWGIRDPLCGMKAYRMSLYRDLGHFDSYDSIGTELMIYAARTRKRIDQIPLKTRDRIDAPRFGKRFSTNKRIFRALLYALRPYPCALTRKFLCVR
jgi:glycosyltransferase involved in cell wall biosynthesis